MAWQQPALHRRARHRGRLWRTRPLCSSARLRRRSRCLALRWRSSVSRHPARRGSCSGSRCPQRLWRHHCPLCLEARRQTASARQRPLRPRCVPAAGAAAAPAWRHQLQAPWQQLPAWQPQAWLPRPQNLQAALPWAQQQPADGRPGVEAAAATLQHLAHREHPARQLRHRLGLSNAAGARSLQLPPRATPHPARAAAPEGAGPAEALPRQALVASRCKSLQEHILMLENIDTPDSCGNRRALALYGPIHCWPGGGLK